MLAEVKRGCLAWFGLLHPHLLLKTKRVLAVLGERDSTKVLGIDPLCWELICNGFNNILEKPGTIPERATKYKFDLMHNSVLHAKR